MIIACYYGDLPDWMDLWLLSCKYNPQFHFMLVTDCAIASLPGNVTLLHLSMDKLRRRFSDVVGFPVALSFPYKLCDFKPVYGLAFQKKLAGYGFWGHCDLDLIWGNLRAFISDDLLSHYDRIGAVGHLTLYRNCENINRFFMRPGAAFPYRTVLTDPDHYGFDEFAGTNLIFHKNNHPFYTELPIADAARFLSRISVFPGNTGPEIYFWKDGRVIRAYQDGDGYKSSEYAYLHFQKKHPPHDSGQNYEEGFYIKSKGFQPRKSTFPSLDEIQSETEFSSRFQDRLDLYRGTRNRIWDFLVGKSGHQKAIMLKKAGVYFLDKWKRALASPKK